MPPFFIDFAKLLPVLFIMAAGFTLMFREKSLSTRIFLAGLILAAFAGLVALPMQ